MCAMANSARELYTMSYRLEREHIRLFFEELATEPNTPGYGTVKKAFDCNTQQRHKLADDCFMTFHSCNVVNSAYQHLRDREEDTRCYIGRERSLNQRISAREKDYYLTEMICKKWRGVPSPFNTPF